METILKKTISRCSQCGEKCSANVVRRGVNPGRVFLEKTCDLHGLHSVCIASDARFYWLAKGASSNACCSGQSCCSADGTGTGTLGINAPGRGEQPFETLSTCLALIEIVHSCNLACPTCYADSPNGSPAHVNAVPLDELKGRIQGVVDRKGGIEILQLSGGEPTLHPQFFDLVKWAQSHPHIDYLLLNTNGVRIARDHEFTRQLGEVFQYGGFQLYLQFDGPQEAGQKALRGADLRKIRMEAIERCRDIHLPITLAMTVNESNLPHLWETIELGLQYPHIRGVSFQPMFLSGRFQRTEQRRLNTADIIVNCVEQSNGKLRYEDFTPLPCGDPNCATIGYLLKMDGAIRSISDFVDFAKVQGFLRDKIRYQLSDLSQCGCENEPLGVMLKQFELDETNTFRLFIKPFMDAGTWDEDRIDRCCTHVIRPDGKLDSFCRYYSGMANEENGHAGLAAAPTRTGVPDHT